MPWVHAKTLSRHPGGTPGVREWHVNHTMYSAGIWMDNINTETSKLTLSSILYRESILTLTTWSMARTSFDSCWIKLILHYTLQMTFHRDIVFIFTLIVEQLREKSCKLWYKHQIWHSDSHGYTKQICQTGHLKIQDGGHFEKWPPNRPSESVFSHGIVYTCSILMILVSIPMFLGMLNSILLV